MNHKILFTLFGLFCYNIITDIAAQMKKEAFHKNDYHRN